MKRDLDLVRKILFKMESEQATIVSEDYPPLAIDGYSKESIIYHMKIMAQADLLHLDEIENSFPIGAHMRGQTQQYKTYVSKYYSISWNGHEFLSAMRDETHWNNVKKIMTKAGGFVTEVAVEVAKTIIRDAAIKMMN